MRSLFQETGKKDKLTYHDIDRIGRTKGYAFVYLKNPDDVDKVIDYVDGRHIRSRQIR